MAGLRGFLALLRVLLRLVLIAPLAALFLSVLVDRGADGELRLSRFPLALLAVDPLVRTCARNSIIFAAVLSASSLVLGITLGWVLGRRSFWGRPLFRGMVLGSLVASPAVLALGLLGILGPAHSWPWPFLNFRASDRGVSLESWSGLGLWLIWLWSCLPAATAVVAAAAASAVERLEPGWEDAARLAGASRVRAWRTVSWPLIRPPTVRAAAMVFALGLLEPGAPLILGMRRTLAYQIVDAASRPAPFPGISAWCLLAGLIALLGALMLRRLSGTSMMTESVMSDRAARLHSHQRAASLSHAAISIAILTVWCLIAWLPVLGLARLASATGDAQSASDGERAGVLNVMASRLREPPVWQLTVNSAFVGLEVTGAILALFWLSGTGRRGRGERPNVEWKAPPLSNALSPPLIVGVGVLATAWLAEAAAGQVPSSGAGPGIAEPLAVFAAWIAPSGNPSLFVAISVAWVLGPCLFLCWRQAAQSPRALAAAIDAARLAGASRVRALWLGAPSVAVTWLGRLILTWALAATNLTPALLASPGTDGPTLGPGLLILADGRPGARSIAATVALCILALDLAAFGLARACGALPRLEDCEPP
jgi:iron(III) transport system permease protein